MDEMDKTPQKFWIIVLTIAVIIMGSYLLMSSFGTTKFRMKCDIDQIRYVDMTNTNSRCYGDFSREFCPLPGRINCEVEGEAPIFLLEKLR